MPHERKSMMAVDVGTSGVRAVACTEELNTVGEALSGLDVTYTSDGGAEQDPEAILSAVQQSIQGASVQSESAGYQVIGLSLGVTASSLVLLQEDWQPGSPVFMWADTRASAAVQEVRSVFGVDLYHRTGCPAHASYLPAKLKWLQRTTGPDVLDGLRVGSMKDYLMLQLTGHWVVDCTVAAASGLYDSSRMIWDTQVMEWLGLGQQSLPEVVGATKAFPLGSTAAAALDLPTGLPVVVGGMDGVLAHLGLGCATPGLMSTMFGSSGALRLSHSSRLMDAHARTWCYPITTDLWVAGGGTSNGGNALEWLVGLLDKEDGDAAGRGSASLEGLISQAAGVAPGADGLTFMPYLLGERSPLWNEHLRGGLFGIRPTHGRAEIARSVLEGICYALLGVYEALVESAGLPQVVRASGGYTRAPEWLQLQADIFGTPVTVTDRDHASAIGAAALGWHSLTESPLANSGTAIRTVRQFIPDPGRHEIYRSLYGEFRILRARLWPE